MLIVCGLSVTCPDSSSESDDVDDNFYAMSDARRRNVSQQWQDRVQRQSRLCLTLTVSKGRFLACTANQVSIVVSWLWCGLSFLLFFLLSSVECKSKDEVCCLI